MEKIKHLLNTETLDYNNPKSWMISYYRANNPTNGKEVGFVRFDYQRKYKMFYEKDFIEHLEKLEGLSY
jgi:hypothetical protein